MKLILDDVGTFLKKINFEPMNNSSVLITGASGIVGTYLTATIAQLVTQKNYKIQTYLVIQHELPEYLQSIFRFSGVKIFRGDITDEIFCRSLPKSDFIIHAAGYGQPGMFLADPIKTLKINTFSTFLLAEKIKKDGRFLFISSSEVYNGLTKAPFKENQIGGTNTNDSRSCYIEGKRTGEAICSALRQQGVQAKSARLSLAYGPGTKVHDKRVLNSFIEKGLQNKKIELLDSGDAKRTYCYITDAIELLWNILLYGKDDIYNVGGTSRTTIAKLAKQIGRLLDVPVIFPTETQSMQGAPSDVYLDMQKSIHEFSKSEFIQLEIGLRKTIDYQKIIYDKSN